MATPVPGGIAVNSELAFEYAGLCDTRSGLLEDPINNITTFLAILNSALESTTLVSSSADRISELFNSDNPPYRDNVKDYAGEASAAKDAVTTVHENLTSLVTQLSTLLQQLITDQSFCKERCQTWMTIYNEKLEEERYTIY